ncbi:hypothetical protein RSOL_037990, partial [Rhizoctonia solani AG-3 Rhs1AP]
MPSCVAHVMGRRLARVLLLVQQPKHPRLSLNHRIIDITVMDILLRPPTCPALKAWEAAGTELAASLNRYMRLSQSLFATAMNENMRPMVLAKRIDEALKLSHCLLDHQLAHSRSALAQARNTLLSQAYRLPDEIFYEIFINVLYPADNSSSRDSMDSALRKIFSTLYRLMSVSRVWWDVILKRSEFWSLLPLYISERLRCLRAPGLGAQRARGPLHLATIVHNFPPLIRLRGSLDSSIIPIRRIQTINISSCSYPDGSAIKQVMLAFLGHNVSSLELREMSLHQMDDGLDDDWIPDNFFLAIDEDSPNWAHFLEIIKLLSVFRVSGAELRWDQVAFSDRLVELRLQRVVLGHDSGLADFLRKLVSSLLCEI